MLCVPVILYYATGILYAPRVSSYIPDLTPLGLQRFFCEHRT